METMENLVRKSGYRVREDMLLVDFILKNSGLTLSYIEKAAMLAHKNPYHNFDHMLVATASGIRMCLAENCSPDEINAVASALLVHDAGHSGRLLPDDEKRSFELARNAFGEADLVHMGKGYAENLALLNKLILSTIFKNRGQDTDKLSMIVQDADLAHVGDGLPTWLYTSMGFLDEFNSERGEDTTPEVFIRQQQAIFIEAVQKMSPSGEFYLSPGAQKIFHDPAKDVSMVSTVSDKAIAYAYKNRFLDITLAEFTAEFEKLNS